MFHVFWKAFTKWKFSFIYIFNVKLSLVLKCLCVILTNFINIWSVHWGFILINYLSFLVVYTEIPIKLIWFSYFTFPFKAYISANSSNFSILKGFLFFINNFEFKIEEKLFIVLNHFFFSFTFIFIDLIIIFALIFAYSFIIKRFLFSFNY